MYTVTYTVHRLSHFVNWGTTIQNRTVKFESMQGNVINIVSDTDNILLYSYIRCVDV